MDRVLSLTTHLRRSPLSFIPPEPYPARFARHLPHWGRWTASAVDRVLSQTAYLRRSSPLFFIPLEPYPACFARHLPHAGKAVIRKSRFSHPTSAPSGHLLPEEGGRSRDAGIALSICGEAATFISDSNFSFVQSFRTRSRDGMPHTYYQRTNE